MSDDKPQELPQAETTRPLWDVMRTSGYPACACSDCMEAKKRIKEEVLTAAGHHPKG